MPDNQIKNMHQTSSKPGSRDRFQPPRQRWAIRRWLFSRLALKKPNPTEPVRTQEKYFPSRTPPLNSQPAKPMFADTLNYALAPFCHRSPPFCHRVPARVAFKKTSIKCGLSRVVRVQPPQPRPSVLHVFAPLSDGRPLGLAARQRQILRIDSGAERNLLSHLTAPPGPPCRAVVPLCGTKAGKAKSRQVEVNRTKSHQVAVHKIFSRISLGYSFLSSFLTGR